ncbi:tetratricopeptide repeat protein [Pseudopedobacter saltans]|uniref:tetratricopeptide repeat protein n=1 Tax=Pseudopedobacter saltans TaxID=151895 RepID=UPI0002DBD644|nr:tetratricopeptide repeat protein [Pseudopedobacter saltans]
MISYFPAFAQKNKEARQNIVLIAGKPISTKDSVTIENLFFLGLQNKLNQQNQAAINNFNSIIALDPQNHNAYYELAQIYFKSKDYEKAKENIQKAITVNGENEWYWVLSATIYQELKDYNLLSYALDELVKLSPDKIEYRLEKANTLMLLQKPGDAIKEYQEIEKNIGSGLETLEGKLRAYRALGDFKSAEEELKKQINLDPANFRYHILLGDLYFNNKDKENAVASYKKAKELDSGTGYVNLALSDIYNSEGRTEEAFSELTQAFRASEINLDQKVKIIISYFSFFPDLKYVRYAESLAFILTEEYPDEAKSFAIYGDVLFQKGEYKKAGESYQRALALNKNIYAVWEQLVRIKLSLNDMKGVIETGDEALTYFPQSGNLYFFVAIGLVQAKQSEKAIEYLNNALNFDVDKPAKIQIYSTLGDAYQNLGKYKESSESYEKALALDANNVYTLNNYAYYLSLRSEKLEKAAQMSSLSNKLDPNNASFLDTYAWILFKQKKYNEAKEWIEKAIKASKETNAVLLEHYGDILYHLQSVDLALSYWKKAKDLGEDSAVLERKINEKKYVE